MDKDSQPAWIGCIAKVPDSLSTAFPPAQLRQIAQVFAEHVHEDPDGVADTNDLLPIMLELGVPVEAGELSKALQVASLEGKAALDFKDFTLVLIHVINGIQKSLANQAPEVFASEVVWLLVSTSVPMVVREGSSLPSRAHFGVAEEMEQDNRSADIDQRAGIADFEERLQKLESASEGGPNGGAAQGKAKAGKPSPYNQLSWTNELRELERLHHEAPRKVWSRSEISTVLRSLKLTDCQITTLDDALLSFPNVEKLDLSGNNISRLGILPPQLTSLTLNSNTVESLADTPPARSLRYLAVAYNGLSSVPHGLETSRFPLLSALDLSGNNLCDVESVIQLLAPLSSLSHLYLIRNPLTLEPAYRRRVLYALRDLELLDDVPNTSTPESDVEKSPPSVCAMLLRVTIESLQGLPVEPDDAEAEGGGAVFGRVQVGILDTAVHTEEMPWSANLVGNEPADDASQGSQAASKKKGKGPTPTPDDAGTEKPAPKVLTMRISISPELRDHLYFEGNRPLQHHHALPFMAAPRTN